MDGAAVHYRPRLFVLQPVFNRAFVEQIHTGQIDVYGFLPFLQAQVGNRSIVAYACIGKHHV